MVRFTRLVGRLVLGHPVVVVATLLVASVITAAGSTLAERSAGSEGFAPDADAVQAQQFVQTRFGGTVPVQILVESDEADLLGPEGVEVGRALETALRNGPVEDLLAPGRSIVGPTTPAIALGLDGAASQQDVRDAFGSAVAAPGPGSARLASLLPAGFDPGGVQPLNRALVVVRLDAESLGVGREARAEALDPVITAVSEASLPEGVTAETFSFELLFPDNDEFQTEITRLFSLAGLVILVILAFVFFVRGRDVSGAAGARRTGADVGLALLVVALSIGWMQGLGGWLGPGGLGVLGPLSPPTQIIPVVLIGLGVDYAIHLTNRTRAELGDGRTVADATTTAIDRVGVALGLATVTTVVGFLTNLTSPVPALRDYGVLAAVGIAAAFLLALTVIPAVRVLLDRRAQRSDRLPRSALAAGDDRLLPVVMGRVAAVADRHPVPVVFVAFVVGGVVGLVGFRQLETEFSLTDFLPEDDPAVEVLDVLEREFGGGAAETTDVLVRGAGVGSVEVHNETAALVDRLAPDPLVVASPEGGAVAETPATLVASAVAEGGPLAASLQAAGARPDGRLDASADAGALYRMLLEEMPEVASQRLAIDDEGAVVATLVTLETRAGEERAEALATALEQGFGPLSDHGLQVDPVSTPIVNREITGLLGDSQLVSLLTSVIAAMVLLTGYYGFVERHGLLGVLTVTPVGLVLLWTFAAMATTGIPFGPITATISALAVGIGVPYTIHVTSRFLEDRVRYGPGEAVRQTVRHTGAALAGSALTTMAGFGVLVSSSLRPFQQFGLVTVYTIGFSLLASTVLLPSLLELWDRRLRRRSSGTP